MSVFPHFPRFHVTPHYFQVLVQNQEESSLQREPATTDPTSPVPTWPTHVQMAEMEPSPVEATETGRRKHIASVCCFLVLVPMVFQCCLKQMDRVCPLMTFAKITSFVTMFQSCHWVRLTTRNRFAPFSAPLPRVSCPVQCRACSFLWSWIPQRLSVFTKRTTIWSQTSWAFPICSVECLRVSCCADVVHLLSAECPKLEHVEIFERTSLYGPYTVGSEVFYTCPDGGEEIITCQNDGTWNIPPHCSGNAIRLFSKRSQKNRKLLPEKYSWSSSNYSLSDLSTGTFTTHTILLFTNLIFSEDPASSETGGMTMIVWPQKDSLWFVQTHKWQSTVDFFNIYASVLCPRLDKAKLFEGATYANPRNQGHRWFTFVMMDLRKSSPVRLMETGQQDLSVQASAWFEKRNIACCYFWTRVVVLIVPIFAENKQINQGNTWKIHCRGHRFEPSSLGNEHSFPSNRPDSWTWRDSGRGSGRKPGAPGWAVNHWKKKTNKLFCLFRVWFFFSCGSISVFLGQSWWFGVGAGLAVGVVLAIVSGVTVALCAKRWETMQRKWHIHLPLNAVTKKNVFLVFAETRSLRRAPLVSILAMGQWICMFDSVSRRVNFSWDALASLQSQTLDLSVLGNLVFFALNPNKMVFVFQQKYRIEQLVFFAQ